MSESWIVLIGVLFGGAGLKVVESWLSRKKTEQDQGIQIRDELRKEIVALRDQLQAAKEEEARLEAEIELWRSKYYDLRDVYSKAQTELMLALERLKASNPNQSTPIDSQGDV